MKTKTIIRLKAEDREKFTEPRIAGYKCDEGKAQMYFWSDEPLGLGIRVTAKGAKSYFYQAKVNGKSMRVTIGAVSDWSIPAAKKEARRLKTQIDDGDDPRQLKAKKEQTAAAEAAEQKKKRVTESVTVAEAWKAYVAERSVAKKDGKPVWGERHKAMHDYMTQAGGEKRTRGRRPGQPATTQPGILVPLMAMRLIDLDEKAIAKWLEKETSKAPTAAALAFRLFRAFLAWCAKCDEFQAAVRPGVCQADSVKNKVPSPQTKKNDSLRRAQIKPWFEAMQKIGNPVIAAYLQGLLLTGARRNELAALKWADVDFQWKSITVRDKMKGERVIPLTPYLENLIAALPRRNEFVFSSLTSASGRLEEPRNPHNAALATAGLPALSLHGLRRSFGTLSEWSEVPVGIVAQIMGHAPTAVAEKHYIQRELDLLHLWHEKIERWILEQAEIKFVPVKAGLHVVAAAGK